MDKPRNDGEWQVVIGIGGFVLLVHLLTSGQYGYTPDELASIDDARRLAWGYTVYPPMTPALARAAFAVLGISLHSARMFSALAHAGSVVLAGFMARDLGGRAAAQALAALAVAVAPMALASGGVLQYVALDYFWWTLAAYCVVRLLRSEDARWWMAVGAAIGLGMQTKYTMGFLALGIAAGVVATPARRYLTSPWLWGGVALSLLIFLPNLMWQVRHQFVSLEFVSQIHARDLQLGRHESFLLDQVLINTNPLTVPLWVMGLFFYFRRADGARFRVLGWMAVAPFVLFLLAQGRGYYVAPVYPMLLAAGAVMEERWLASLRPPAARAVWVSSVVLVVAAGIAFAAVVLPIAPVRTPWWAFAARLSPDFRDEIGWPELVAQVAHVYRALPVVDGQRAAILAAHYGEAGAVDLYGPALGLPEAISGSNNYWARGYGDPPPAVVVVVGLPAEEARGLFYACEEAGRVMNSLRVINQETRDHPYLYVCSNPQGGWPETWKRLRRYE